ncbi:RHS repeat-associated core domain-containing protein, partial [Halomonas sp. HNIBRBA4712]|uniref:RHS repeat-associated core domain-containing protein n=1 Tax=Halomonas sp. HNIBRBA4712 TaxID=3373087 RepID=UPI003746B600
GHLHGLSAPGLDLEIDLTPDALHREIQRRLTLEGHGQAQPLILERGYTNLGQLDHLTLRGAQSSGGQQYQYDALGRMSFRALQGDQAKVIAYSYDAAGRLTGSQYGDQAHRYAVDAAGNPLDGQQPVTDNRVTQHNGARYRYDGAGNMIERQQPDGERLTMGYDGANRLVNLTRTSAYGSTMEAAYRYDALGRRINKTVRQVDGNTATTHYGWDGDRIVREESESQRSTIVYEPGSFVPMLRIDDTQQGSQLSAFVTDAIGTPMQLVAANGETQWQGQPDDWAAVRNERANTVQPIRFQGQWYDEESGLYYNRHRYYDPQQGRYISQDPIGLQGGTNLYGYVANPTGAVDPLGLFSVIGCPENQSGLDGAVDGVLSLGTGLQRFFRYAARSVGIYGLDEARNANREGRIIDAAAKEYVTNPNARELANSAIIHEARQPENYCEYNQGRVISRVGVGLWLSPIGALATMGDISYGVEQGSRTVDEILGDGLYGAE